MPFSLLAKSCARIRSSSIHPKTDALNLQFITRLLSSYQIHSSISPKTETLDSNWKNSTGLSSFLIAKFRTSYGCGASIPNSGDRLFSSVAAAEPSTTDGLTVEGIIAKQWSIVDENDNDWKSHASAIAQSIHLIKKRLKWKKLKVRLEMLSAQLDKPDLWEDPVRGGKISREHGSLMGKMKEVKAFEQELLDHIDMIKLAHEDDDAELESVGPHYFILSLGIIEGVAKNEK